MRQDSPYSQLKGGLDKSKDSMVPNSDNGGDAEPTSEISATKGATTRPLVYSRSVGLPAMPEKNAGPELEELSAVGQFRESALVNQSYFQRTRLLTSALLASEEDRDEH